MSRPTPVITSSMTSVSGSTASSMGTLSEPARIHSAATTCAGAPEWAANSASESANAAASVPQPTADTNALPARLPTAPSTTKPASGSSGTARTIQSAVTASSPLEQLEVVEVDAGPVPEHGDGQGQPDRGL